MLIVEKNLWGKRELKLVLGKYAWLEVKEHLVSFGSSEMPNDVHLTLAYNEASPRLNLHLTKNMQEGGKLRIDIFTVAKKYLQENWELISRTILGNALLPIDIDALASSEVYRVDVNLSSTADSDQVEWLSSLLKVGDGDLVNRPRKKGVRSKLIDEFDDRFDGDEAVRLIEEMIVPFNPDDAANEIQWVIDKEGKLHSLIRAHGQWYQLKQIANLEDILSLLLSEEDIMRVKNHMKEAILALAESQSPSELRWAKRPFTLMAANYPGE
ncbi:MAG: hypothetical protein RhofKO_37700 [Rhodothermales bacterium]